LRPGFSDQELTFLLELLRETEARKNRQILSLQEEQKHAQMSVDSLHHRLIFEDPYSVHRELKAERVRLELLEREWLPVCSKQAAVLRGLIVRLEKILAHKRGRILRTSCMVETYLKEICTKDVPKTLNLLA
jgi:hypothetical protein